MTANLTNVQLQFIKDFAYGLPLVEIKKHNCINSDNEFMLIRKEIHKKLKLPIDCDAYMIYEAYINNLFSIDDYFITYQRDIAFATAFNIYMINENIKIKGLTLRELYVKVLRVHVKIINNHKLKLSS